jgi:hypothetical protein
LNLTLIPHGGQQERSNCCTLPVASFIPNNHNTHKDTTVLLEMAGFWVAIERLVGCRTDEPEDSCW